MGAETRVILFGLGPIGAAIGRLIAEKPGALIVAAIDVDPAKAGQDVGEVIGLGRALGVAVSADAQAALTTGRAVVIHCTGSLLPSVIGQLKQCLAAGHDVVSTCEELSYPWRKHPDLSRELDQFAQKHDRTVHGTGVNPGFVMDKLPLTLTSMCQAVETIDVKRVVDAGRRRLPLQQKVGAGITEEAFREAVASGKIKHHGLPESAALIADGLGRPLDELSETIEPVIATAPVTTDYLTVPAGRVAGVQQVCIGKTAGVAWLRLELQMYVGAQAPGDTVTVGGTPDLQLVIPGGTHGDLATAAAVVNAVPRVVEALPGLKTVLDLPVRFARTYGSAAQPVAAGS